MRVNVFRGSYAEAVENDINAWLIENPNLTITHIAQSESATVNGRYLAISIWYDERTMEDEPASTEGQ